jgi:PAS domain S-box-containing protein
MTSEGQSLLRTALGPGYAAGAPGRPGVALEGTLLNALGEAVIATDPEGRVVYWNDAARDLYGWSAEEVLGRSILEVTPATEVRDEAERIMDSLGRGESWSGQHLTSHKDGTRIPVMVTNTPILDDAGDLIGIVGVSHNATGTWQTEDERRLLVRAGMILDRSLDYQVTLPSLARLVADRTADLCVIRVLPRNRHGGFTASAHGDAKKDARLAEVVTALEAEPAGHSVTGRALLSGEPVLVAPLPDGLRTDPDPAAPLSVVAHAMGLESALVLPVRARASVFGFMLLGRTGQPAFRPDHLQGADELARRIGAAIDHARMYESEQLARRAKDDFLAIVSHELRTPLTAILGYADLLAEEIAGPLTAQQRTQVQRIQAGTDRLHRTIESILAYVRLETGHHAPRLEPVATDQILDRLQAIVGPRAEEDGVVFRMEVNGLPRRVVTDADWVLQILLALLTNALKFTRQGEVALSARQEENDLVIDVRDSGDGIPEKHQPYVFNPFWQAEQPATRRAGGAGLGLSVAQRLARRLNGDVTIAASSAAGTTFRFRLPLASGGAGD